MFNHPLWGAASLTVLVVVDSPSMACPPAALLAAVPVAFLVVLLVRGGIISRRPG